VSHAAREWERCAPWLQATLDYEGFPVPLDWYREQVVAGRMQFWPAEDSAGVTQLLPNAHGLTLEIVLIGGKAATLERMLIAVEAWAARQGCRKVTFWGRRGWARLFPARAGYKVSRVRLEKEIAHVRQFDHADDGS
jgi:hypothetical protein